VTYQVDGQPSNPINSNSRTLTISPGLTVSVLQPGTTSIAVSQTGSGISNALSSFANAYNTVVDQLSNSRGQNGGALSGQSIVYSLSGVLRGLASYTSASGSTTSLADLGLSFDQNGHLQFDSTAFAQNNGTSLNNVLSFLGTESGGGFLQAANSLLASVTDPTSGLLPQESQSTADELTSLAQKISADQDQITQLQQNLTKQMAAADALISSLEQQVTQITNLFSAMQQASKAITG
jgi:flagellar hook-associated protein 2